MGTNYYAVITPTKERKEHLKSVIDKGGSKEVKEEVESIFGRFSVDEYSGETSGNEVHLGKHSYRWKFLSNPNIYIRRH